LLLCVLYCRVVVVGVLLLLRSIAGCRCWLLVTWLFRLDYGCWFIVRDAFFFFLFWWLLDVTFWPVRCWLLVDVDCYRIFLVSPDIYYRCSVTGWWFGYVVVVIVVVLLQFVERYCANGLLLWLLLVPLLLCFVPIVVSVFVGLLVVVVVNVTRCCWLPLLAVGYPITPLCVVVLFLSMVPWLLRLVVREDIAVVVDLLDDDCRFTLLLLLIGSDVLLLLVTALPFIPCYLISRWCVVVAVVLVRCGYPLFAVVRLFIWHLFVQLIGCCCCVDVRWLLLYRCCAWVGLLLIMPAVLMLWRWNSCSAVLVTVLRWYHLVGLIVEFHITFPFGSDLICWLLLLLLVLRWLVVWFGYIPIYYVDGYERCSHVCWLMLLFINCCCWLLLGYRVVIGCCIVHAGIIVVRCWCCCWVNDCCCTLRLLLTCTCYCIGWLLCLCIVYLVDCYCCYLWLLIVAPLLTFGWCYLVTVVVGICLLCCYCYGCCCWLLLFPLRLLFLGYLLQLLVCYWRCCCCCWFDWLLFGCCCVHWFIVLVSDLTLCLIVGVLRLLFTLTCCDCCFVTVDAVGCCNRCHGDGLLVVPVDIVRCRCCWHWCIRWYVRRLCGYRLPSCWCALPICCSVDVVAWLFCYRW